MGFVGMASLEAFFTNLAESLVWLSLDTLLPLLAWLDVEFHLGNLVSIFKQARSLGTNT